MAKIPVTDWNFPPNTYLGYTLNMIAVGPADIMSIIKAINTSGRWISIGSKGVSQAVGGGATWVVPTGVGVATDVSSSDYEQYFETGSAAAQAIQESAELAGRYLAVSGDASLNYSVQTMFQNQYSFSMFSWAQALLNVNYEDWADNIDEATIKKALEILPKDGFNSEDPNNVSQYATFFTTIGTHVVTGLAYGSRLQMITWALNQNMSYNDQFEADVRAKFNGLTSGGIFDASITDEDQYTSFSSNYQKTCSVFGGDPARGALISTGPEASGSFSFFKDWLVTTSSNPDVISMTLLPFWTILASSFDPGLNAAAADLSKAYTWITANPTLKTVSVRMVVNSDWGEVGILTPSAVVLADDTAPDPPDGTVIAPTKVSWGREQSCNFQQDVTIDFLIKNDGSPIDIQISHGSDGSTPGAGQCTVFFNDKSYDNTGITDNNWNSRWFYGCPVSG